VSSTLQNKTDVGGAPSTSAPPAAVAAGFPEHGVRQRYVVGVFREPSDAYGAIAGLSPDPCEVLVVFDAAPGREAKSAVLADGRVTIDTLEASGTRAAKLTAALCKLGTFAALSAQSWTDAQSEFPSLGMQRLFQNLVHHLAAGAAVVIIHTPGTEQQLRVSRALLDAKCDTLLTHDVLPTGCGSAPEPAHKEDCCQSCTTRSCGRIGPP
jgi:hypothetical protein